MAFTRGIPIHSAVKKLGNVDESANFFGSPTDKRYQKKFREIKVVRQISRLEAEVN